MLIVVFDVELSLTEAGSTPGPLAAGHLHWQSQSLHKCCHLGACKGLWHEWYHLGILHFPHPPKPTFLLALTGLENAVFLCCNKFGDILL